MSILEGSVSSVDQENIPEKKEEPFFPVGAIVFFVLLVVLCITFWYSIYFLMVKRA